MSVRPVRFLDGYFSMEDSDTFIHENWKFINIILASDCTKVSLKFCYCSLIDSGFEKNYHSGEANLTAAELVKWVNLRLGLDGEDGYSESKFVLQ